MRARHREHRLFEPPAIMRQIVAGDGGERRQAGGAPRRQRRDEEAGRGPRRGQVGEIGGDVGIVGAAARRSPDRAYSPFR